MPEKHTTNRARKGIARKLKLRALDIIASDAYAVDTQNAIRRAVQQGDAADLRELLDIAESGQEIWDLTGDPPEIDEQRALARHLSSALTNNAIPDELYNAMVCAITDMANSLNNESENYIYEVLRAYKRYGPMPTREQRQSVDEGRAN